MTDKDALAKFNTPSAGKLAPAAAGPYRPARWNDAPASPAAHVRQLHQERLLALDGVTGVAIGPTRTGIEGIIVYVRDRSMADSLPAAIDGIPVEVVVTGIIDAR